MDILILGLFISLALTLVALDYYKDSPHLGILGGIVFILLGIFLAIDGTISTLVCNI